MKRFEINKTYSMHSPCQYDCVWTYTVIARTAKTMTLRDDRGNIKKCKVYELDNKEYAKPLGSYSMCPILMAK